MPGDRLEAWTHEAVAEYRRLRDRLVEHVQVFARNDAAGGRNLQEVRAVAGASTTDDNGNALYPGKVTWRDAARTVRDGPDCWIMTEGGGAPTGGDLCLCFNPGLFQGRAVFWWTCDAAAHVAATAVESVCLNGTLTRYRIKPDGGVQIVSQAAGCCNNGGGDSSGAGTCTQNFWHITPTYSLQGSEVDDGCVPSAEVSWCLSGPTPYDCGGGVTGQRWTGSGANSGLAITKCGLLWCITTGLGLPGVTPTTNCSQTVDPTDPCGVPLTWTVPASGDPRFLELLTVSAESCTPLAWNCWSTGTPDQPGDIYCSQTDDSATATQIGGPYSTVVDCQASCVEQVYCVEDNTTKQRSCVTTWDPATATVLSGPHADTGACGAVCVNQLYCWRSNAYPTYTYCALVGTDPADTQVSGPYPDDGSGACTDVCGQEWYCFHQVSYENNDCTGAVIADTTFCVQNPGPGLVALEVPLGTCNNGSIFTLLGGPYGSDVEARATCPDCGT